MFDQAVSVLDIGSAGMLASAQCIGQCFKLGLASAADDSKNFVPI
jgi:hypothetical protein